MVVQGLMSEFLHETENTRKLLQAIPDSALDYKPAENSWTTAQLAAHIVGLYNWFPSVLELDVFDIATYQYDKGDISNMRSILAKFEENVKIAQGTLERLTKEALFEDWTMKNGEIVIIPPMKRIGIMRSVLLSHIYHHRGEMIVYLRATGNKVPGLYGPTYEEMNP